MTIFFKPKGSAILTTIFLMFAILSISAIGLDVILGGMAARRAQGASTRAYYAAEGGVERALSVFKIRGEEILANPACSGDYLNLDKATSGLNDLCWPDEQKSQLLNLNNLPSYTVKIQSISGRTVELLSRGSYQETNRELFIRFCLPSCQGKSTGDLDDCGGTCK